MLEREGAADDEGDEVVAPVLARIRDLCDELAALVDAVARDVGADVGVRRGVVATEHPAAHLAGVEHVEDRARLRVALGEEHHVEGERLRQGDDVGLGVAARTTPSSAR